MQSDLLVARVMVQASLRDRFTIRCLLGGEYWSSQIGQSDWSKKAHGSGRKRSRDRPVLVMRKLGPMQLMGRYETGDRTSRQTTWQRGDQGLTEVKTRRPYQRTSISGRRWHEDGYWSGEILATRLTSRAPSGDNRASGVGTKLFVVYY